MRFLSHRDFPASPWIVPGDINDLFDGGVRQMIGPRGERGLASIDGVGNLSPLAHSCLLPKSGAG
ncbi:MAG TPA: hypothetical protein VLK82_04705 [Candidatus Tectomicrobia bacterium]|nr:hypothetical protein [Candidatus Tectomicrobia bacterium]